MEELLDVIHKTIYQFFDACEDDEEVPMSDKDKLLLEVNKAICNNIKALDVSGINDSDLISRQAAIDAVETIGFDFSDSDLSESELEEVCEAIGEVRQIWSQRIKRLPSVEPARKTGKWINRNSFLVPYRCSECNYESERYDNFCPNCGANMWDLDSESS